MAFFCEPALYLTHVLDLSTEDRRKFNQLREMPADFSEDEEEDHQHSFDAFINGEEAFQQSHAGDLNDILEAELEEDMNAQQKKWVDV